MTTVHVPVLAAETLELLDIQPGATVVDGTLGGGGHTRLLAERVGSAGQVISTDRDPAAVAAAANSLAGLPLMVVQSNFCELPSVLQQLELPGVDAILLDLGLSSDQLSDAERGFSFDSEGDFDLRFDPEQGEPAWSLLGRLRAEDLADIIYQYGEERFSRRIARKIVEVRRQHRLRTAAEVADVVRSCVPRSRGHKIDPATRTFQALRIAVNSELESLEIALREFPNCLNPGGRLGIISFHSLEDRRVKHAFRDDPRWERVTRKPVRPTEEEQRSNPRSRSARFRVARRVAE